MLEKVFEVVELSPFRNFSLKMETVHVKIFETWMKCSFFDELKKRNEAFNTFSSLAPHLNYWL